VLRRELARRRIGEEVVLGPLDPGATAAMLAGILGVAVPGPTVAEVARRSGGNPFAVEELVKDGLESGRLDPGTAALAPAPPGALPWSLRDMVGNRLARLAAGERRLIEDAVVLGDPFPVALLEAVAGLGEDDLFAALGRLRDAGLVEDVPGDPARMRVRHALVREAVEAGLVAADRRRRHARVLRIAAEQGVDLTLDERLTHAIGAGDRAQVHELSLAAARAARRLGGLAEADAHYRRAAEAWAGPAGAPPPAALLQEWGNLLADVGRRPEALDLLTAAREGFRAAGDPDGQTEAAARADWVRFMMGEPAALDDLRALVRAPPPGAPPAALASAMSLLARLLLNADSAIAATSVAHEALALLETVPPDRGAVERMRMLNVIGVAEMEAGRTAEGAGRLDEASRVARALGDRRYEVITQANVASMGARDGPLALADLGSRADRSLALARASGLRADEGWLLFVRAGIHLRAAEPAPVPALLDAAEVVAEEIGGSVHERATLAILRGEHALLLGDLGRARAELQAAVGHAAAGAGNQDDDARFGLMRALRAEGEVDAAWAVIEPWVGVAEATPAVLGMQGALLCGAVEVAALRGDAARAAAMAGLLAAHAPGPRARHAGAVAAAAAGEPADLADVAAAVGEVEATGRAWEGVRMRLGAGEVLGIAGVDRRALAEIVAPAREVALGIGAGPWVRRAEQLMRALGRRVSGARSGSGQAGLTRRELEVLRLVAAGLTNRQISERLYISEPTAATHVTHILQKLRVQNRAEAARVAAERGLAGEG
jgi:DNA-binding CsgD family transcriptional regulator/tetratricopeptide (TPR) repeat protein